MKSLLAACLLLWSQLTWGSIALIATSLPSGSALVQPPSEISLIFNEPVRVAQADLVSPQGQTVPLYVIRDAGAEVRVPIPALAAYGIYALHWRVASVAGEAASGMVGYELAEPGLLHRLWPSSALRWRDVALWLATIVLLAASVSLALFRPQFLSATLGLVGMGLVATGFQFGRVAALWGQGSEWLLPALCAGALLLLVIVGAGRMWLRGR